MFSDICWKQEFMGGSIHTERSAVELGASSFLQNLLIACSLIFHMFVSVEPLVCTVIISYHIKMITCTVLVDKTLNLRCESMSRVCSCVSVSVYRSCMLIKSRSVSASSVIRMSAKVPSLTRCVLRKCATWHRLLGRRR